MSSRELSTAGCAVSGWADMVVAGEGGAEWAELESVCVEVMAWVNFFVKARR